MTVEILLATYNGEAYIESFLESLKAQTYPDIFLTIRDDGSSDQTVDRIEKCLSSWKKPWRWLSVPTSARGPMHNFSTLLNHANAPYVMFADQDDIWLPEKVNQSLNLMKHLENKRGTDRPILVHSDLQVVDANLNLIAPSFWNYSFMNPNLNSLNRTLVQNYIPGCTMMLNRALVDFSQPFPTEALMHDWWMLIVASAFGEVGCIREPLTLYRQHSNNCIGASRGRFLNIRAIKNKLSENTQQTKAFYKMYQNKLSTEQQKMVHTLAHLDDMNFFQKRKVLVKYRFFKHYWVHNLGLFILI